MHLYDTPTTIPVFLPYIIVEVDLPHRLVWLFESSPEWFLETQSIYGSHPSDKALDRYEYHRTMAIELETTPLAPSRKTCCMAMFPKSRQNSCSSVAG